MTATTQNSLGDGLLALARNMVAAKTGFTRADLHQWMERLDHEPPSEMGPLKHLKLLGMVRRVARPEGKPQLPRGYLYFALTTVGEEAAKAAQATGNHSARARGARVVAARRAGASPFAARLWALLRARRMLTAVEAANVLLDVCDEATFHRARRAAAEYLLAWSRNHPDHVHISAARRNNEKRYVLVKDMGMAPPADPRHPPPPVRAVPAASAMAPNTAAAAPPVSSAAA